MRTVIADVKHERAKQVIDTFIEQGLLNKKYRKMLDDPFQCYLFLDKNGWVWKSTPGGDFWFNENEA